MSYPLARLLTAIAPQLADLPYNLAWRLKLNPQIRRFLDLHPIQIVDVGSRNGSTPELATLCRYSEYVGFDADPNVVDQPKTGVYGEFRSARIYPYFVGATEGRVQFNIYKRGGESSRFFPDPYYASKFSPGTFDVAEQIDVDGFSLDHIAEKEVLTVPDILKIDTQGTELEILSGAKQWVGKVPLIEVEVEFLPIYQGQPLFYEVGSFMHRHGYMLLYLNRVFTSRIAFRGESRGQIVFGDAMYGLGPDRVAELDPVARSKYVLLLINYGVIDYAFELASCFPDIREMIPGIDRYFTPRRPLLSWIWRLFWMQLDKLLILIMWWRKTNQLRTDSDRSWPIR